MRDLLMLMEKTRVAAFRLFRMAPALGLLCVQALTPTRGEDAPAVAPIPISNLNRSKPVDFESEVLPLFRKSCLACHNASDAKGELVLETPDTIKKGGESGPVVNPEKPLESLLLKLAARQEKPVMPPRNNKAGADPLSPDELGLVQLWISQGATGVVSAALAPVKWQPLPPGLKAVNAAAISPDGQFAAAARANQIFIYHLPSNQLFTRLTDPELLQSGFASQPGVAERDLVQSLAFSPDGTTLASGGYRVVKLWQKQPNAPLLELPYAAAGGVQSIASSPDGKWLATGGTDGTLKLWESQTGKLLKEFTGHTKDVMAVSFSENGSLLASGSLDGTIRVWKPTEGQPVASANASNEVRAIAWLKADELASGGGVPAIRLWKIPAETNLLTGIGEMTGHEKPVTSLARVTPNTLVSGSADKSVRLWNLEKKELMRTWDPGAEVTAVAARPDGKRVASAGTNNRVRLWNPDSNDLVAEIKGDREAQEFSSRMEADLQFAKSEVEYFKSSLKKAEESQKSETEALKKATEAKDKAEKAFAERTEAQKKAAEAKAAAEKAVTDLAASIKAAREKKPALEKENTEAAAQAKTLSEKAAEIKASFEKSAQDKAALFKQLVEAAFQAKLAAYQSAEAKSDSQQAAEAKALSEKAASEKLAAVETLVAQAIPIKASYDKLLAEKDSIEKSATEAQAKAKTLGEAFAANEKIVAEAEKNTKEAHEKAKAAQKQLADAESALKQAEGVRGGALQNFEATTLALKRAGEAVQKATESGKQAEMIVAQAERSLESARRAAELLEKPIHSLAFSPDNLLLAFGSEDGVIRTASSENGILYEKFARHAGKISSVTFLPDGRMASGAADQTARIWNSRPQWSLARKLGTGSEDSPLVDRILALDFSPDGKSLATGGGFPSRSGEIKIWQVSDGALIRNFKDPHSDTVYSMDFSPDGKWLASGGADKFLRVFDVESGRQAKTFEGHTHHVFAVSWKRDGRMLASGSGDKTIKLWDFESGEQRRTIQGFGKEITFLRFVRSSNEIMVTCGDTQVKIVRDDGNNVRSFAGMAEFVSTADLTPDGKIVVAGSVDGILRAWDAQKGTQLAAFEPPKEEPSQLAASK